MLLRLEGPRIVATRALSPKGTQTDRAEVTIADDEPSGRCTGDRYYSRLVHPIESAALKKRARISWRSFSYICELRANRGDCRNSTRGGVGPLRRHGNPARPRRRRSVTSTMEQLVTQSREATRPHLNIQSLDAFGQCALSVEAVCIKVPRQVQSPRELTSRLRFDICY
jgi:hypothetical protein